MLLCPRGLPWVSAGTTAKAGETCNCHSPAVSLSHPREGNISTDLTTEQGERGCGEDTNGGSKSPPRKDTNRFHTMAAAGNQFITKGKSSTNPSHTHNKTPKATDSPKGEEPLLRALVLSQGPLLVSVTEQKLLIVAAQGDN